MTSVTTDSCSNEVGRCVNGSDAPGLLQDPERQWVAAQIGRSSVPRTRRPTTCPSPGFPPIRAASADAATDLDPRYQAPSRAVAIPPVGGTFDAPDLEAGYCSWRTFRIPSNPTINCYDDASPGLRPMKVSGHGCCLSSRLRWRESAGIVFDVTEEGPTACRTRCPFKGQCSSFLCPNVDIIF